MKRKLFLLTLATTLLFSIGCSKKAASSAGLIGGLAYDDVNVSSQVVSKRASSREMEIPEEANDTDLSAGNFADAERKLVKTAIINIRVDNLAKADDSVSALLKKYEAYAASTNIHEDSRYYSLRIPSNYYDVFLGEVNGLGRLINRIENTEDVTLRYYDLEGRLATKKELLKTFQAYLGKANNIEEILSVEARISELQYDIEGTGIQLRNLSNKVDYATVSLHLAGPATSTSYRGVPFGERVKQLFGGFGSFLSTVGMVLIGIVIYGIPILLILGLLFLLLFGRIGIFKKLWRLIKS